MKGAVKGGILNTFTNKPPSPETKIVDNIDINIMGTIIQELRKKLLSSPKENSDIPRDTKQPLYPYMPFSKAPSSISKILAKIVL